MPYCTNCGTEEAADQQFCPTCGQATAGDFAGIAKMPYFPMDQPADAREPLANFWWRVLGYVLDSLVLAIVVTLPLRGMNVNLYAASFIDVAIVFAYGTLLLTRNHGQTIGMKIVRIRVVDATSHEPVGVAQAVRRTLLYCAIDLVGTVYHYSRYLHPTAAQKVVQDHDALIAVVLIIPLVIDLLWPLWDKRNQTLHDKFARTVVMRPVAVP